MFILLDQTIELSLFRIGYTGPTTCDSGYTCVVLNPYYSEVSAIRCPCKIVSKLTFGMISVCSASIATSFLIGLRVFSGL